MIKDNKIHIANYTDKNINLCNNMLSTITQEKPSYLEIYQDLLRDKISASEFKEILFNGIFLPNVQKYFSYLKSHKHLLQDKIRVTKFREAILKTVKLNDIVLDIGAGTGILSLFAIEAGARKVYAVEENKNILDVAIQKFKEYGLTDKIELIHANSKELLTSDIPEKVDLVISETIGNFGLNEGILSNMIDAKRFMNSNGIFLPQDIEVFIVPVQLKESLHKDVTEYGIPFFSIDFVNEESDSYSFLGEPVKLLSIKFSDCASPQINLQTTINIKNKGFLHGLMGWFSSNLANNIHLNNSPFQQQTSWYQSFILLNDNITVNQNDIISVNFRFRNEKDHLTLNLSIKNIETRVRNFIVQVL